MSSYAAAIGGGYKPVAQLSLTEASGGGAGLVFSGLVSGRAYTLQIKTGTMKVNFMGATGDTLDLAPGLYRNVVDWNVLRSAKVDIGSPFTAVLLLENAA